MIVKELCKEKDIFQMEVLVNRISTNHPKYPDIKESLRRKRAGFNGERAISYYLDYLPDQDYYIFHNLRLKGGKYYFQIDYLILTRFFALILECKNYYGTLFIDSPFEQFIRKTQTQEQGFQNPISQAKWHREQLLLFLHQNGLSELPIDFLVAISDPSTILKTDSSNRQMLKKMVHGYNLLERIKEIQGYHKKERLDLKRVRRLSKLLVKSHTPKEEDILKKYKIEKSEVATGVQCPNCHFFAMIRKQRKWFCPHCSHFDQTAHMQALKDYFLIMNSSITNKQFREFVHLSSVDAASKLLIRMNLPFSGSKKGRIYFPHADFL